MKATTHTLERLSLNRFMYRGSYIKLAQNRNKEWYFVSGSKCSASDEEFYMFKDRAVSAAKEYIDDQITA